jgi:hypothetical protein
MSITPLRRGRSGSRAINEQAAALDAAIRGTTYTVATAPSAVGQNGRVIYLSNGSAGSPCAAISDGTNWKVLAIGATIAAE